MKKIFYPLFVFSISALLLLNQCTSTRHKSGAGDATKTGKSGGDANVVTNGGQASQKSLQGTWKFDYFTMVNTDKKILFPLQIPEITFDTKSKKFSGQAGCNNISGAYSQEGENLSFRQPMIMTRMSCNSSGEKIFIDYINSVQKFRINGNSLELIADVKPIIVMQKVVK